MQVFSHRLGRRFVQVVMLEHGQARLEPQFLMIVLLVMQEHGQH